MFNFNGIVELPFGRGKRFLNSGGIGAAIFGGWQFTSIVRISSGAPFSILDTRGTLNRTGRSARQTALSSLSQGQIRDLVGIYRTPDGVFFIDPAVINPEQVVPQKASAARPSLDRCSSIIHRELPGHWNATSSMVHGT